MIKFLLWQILNIIIYLHHKKSVLLYLNETRTINYDALRKGLSSHIDTYMVDEPCSYKYKLIEI